MFEKAARLKLRFNTVKGLLTVEDLWDLPLTKLNEIAKGLNKKLKTIEEEDFLEEVSKEDEQAKLEFDIVIHILNTKKKEKDIQKNMVKKKAEKQKILDIIERKQDSSLEDLSVDELKAKLNEI